MTGFWICLVLSVGLVACGGPKGGKGSQAVAAPVYSSLSCEVGYYLEGNDVAKVPAQKHLKQTALLTNGEAYVETPEFEKGGSRFGYAASRMADGQMALVVQCGNGTQTHSFSASGPEAVGIVQCSEDPLPDFMYFATTEERAGTPRPAWETAPHVKSILVSCKVK